MPGTLRGNSPRGIAIGGFMGTGKSTVGPLLAEHLGLPFVDLDQEIERSSGLSVRQIFAREGENGFRQRESGELRRLTSRGPSVVALGGGTLHQPGWQEALQGFQLIVLQASWSVVQKRLVAEEKTRRPLSAEAQSLFQERLAGYRAAGIQIQVDGLSPEQVLECMLNRLPRGEP